jgi:hypothetical protein
MEIMEALNVFFRPFSFHKCNVKLLQPWASLGLLYNQSPPGVWFLNKIIFYSMRLLAPCPTPNLEDQGLSLSPDSTL